MLCCLTIQRPHCYLTPRLASVGLLWSTHQAQQSRNSMLLLAADANVQVAEHHHSCAAPMLHAAVIAALRIEQSSDFVQEPTRAYKYTSPHWRSSLCAHEQACLLHPQLAHLLTRHQKARTTICRAPTRHSPAVDTAQTAHTRTLHAFAALAHTQLNTCWRNMVRCA
jgi:hypothetical protein